MILRGEKEVNAKYLSEQIDDLQTQIKSYNEQLDNISWRIRTKGMNCECHDCKCDNQSWRAYME